MPYNPFTAQQQGFLRIGQCAFVAGLAILLPACVAKNSPQKNPRQTETDHSSFSKAIQRVGASISASTRYIKLNAHGFPLPNQGGLYNEEPWSCIYDRHTQLIWENKTNVSGLHDQNNRYTWYNPNPSRNGGNRGVKNRGQCQFSRCDTQGFIKKLNQIRYCGITTWRLPEREELRSLVDYELAFPGPTLHAHYFPQGLSRFYWSASPDAEDRDSAWGIGFSFGFDYTYLKQHAGYVRAVSFTPSANE